METHEKVSLTFFNPIKKILFYAYADENFGCNFYYSYSYEKIETIKDL